MLSAGPAELRTELVVALLLISSGAGGLLALAIPFLPFRELFGFVRIPIKMMLLIVGITAAYVAAVEILKQRFYRQEQASPSQN